MEDVLLSTKTTQEISTATETSATSLETTTIIDSTIETSSSVTIEGPVIRSIEDLKFE